MVSEDRRANLAQSSFPRPDVVVCGFSILHHAFVMDQRKLTKLESVRFPNILPNGRRKYRNNESRTFHFRCLPILLTWTAKYDLLLKLTMIILS